MSASSDGFRVSDPENRPVLITFPLNLLSAPPHVSAYFQTGSQWNQKVIGFDFNLVGTGELLRSSGGRLATVHLLQRGIAAVRQHGDNGLSAIVFDADPWKDRNAPFGRPNASTYQNVSINAVDRASNYQSAAGDPLHNRAVSATEWTLFLDPAISDQGQFGLTLNLTELTDIEILISYSHGAPPDWR